jgi:hypothetical protein
MSISSEEEELIDPSRPKRERSNSSSGEEPEKKTRNRGRLIKTVEQPKKVAPPVVVGVMARGSSSTKPPDAAAGGSGREGETGLRKLLAAACAEIRGHFVESEIVVGPFSVRVGSGDLQKDAVERIAREEAGDTLSAHVECMGKAVVYVHLRRKTPPQGKEVQRWLASLLLSSGQDDDEGKESVAIQWSFLTAAAAQAAKAGAEAMGLHTTAVVACDLFDGVKSYEFQLSTSPIIESSPSCLPPQPKVATERLPAAPLPAKAAESGGHVSAKVVTAPSAQEDSSLSVNVRTLMTKIPNIFHSLLPSAEQFGNSPSLSPTMSSLRLFADVPPQVAKLISNSIPVRYETDRTTGRLYFRRAVRHVVLNWHRSAKDFKDKDQAEVVFFMEYDHIKIDMEELAHAQSFIYEKPEGRMIQTNSRAAEIKSTHPDFGSDQEFQVVSLLFRRTAKPQLLKEGYTLLFSPNGRESLTQRENSVLRASCAKLAESTQLSEEHVYFSKGVTSSHVNAVISSVPMWYSLGICADICPNGRHRSDENEWFVYRRARTFDYYRDRLKLLSKAADGATEVIPMPSEKLLDQLYEFAAGHGLVVSLDGKGTGKCAATVRRLTGSNLIQAMGSNRVVERVLAQQPPPALKTMQKQPQPPPLPQPQQHRKTESDPRELYLRIAEGQSLLPPGWTCRYSEVSQQFMLFDHLSRKCYRAADTVEAQAQFSHALHFGLAQVRLCVEQQSMDSVQVPERYSLPPTDLQQFPLRQLMGSRPLQQPRISYV